MSAPPPSQKDGQQVLKYAFDDATGSLRTNATLVADSVTLNIDSLDDSIAIGDAITGKKLIVNSDGTINVNVENFPATQAVTQSTSPWVISGTVTANAGTNLNTSALALESGGHLASIDTKTPALGQALAAASVPVVLTAAQLSTLTPLSTVAVTQSTSPWVTSGTSTVSGTVTANIGTTGGLALDSTVSGLLTDTELRATPVPISGTVTANAGSNLNTSALALDSSVNGILVTQASSTSGEKGPLVQGAATTSAPSYSTATTNPLSLTTAGALRVDGSAVTQPVSLAAALTLTSTVNSSTTPLGSNGVFSGSYELISSYSEITLVYVSDHSSAASGVVCTFSSDGVNSDSSCVFTFDVTQLNGDTITLPTVSKYFKISYTNGSVAQTYFRLQTQYRTVADSAAAVQFNTTLTDNTIANLTRSLIVGKSTSGNSYINVKVNPSGALSTAVGDISGVVGQQAMASSLPVVIASNQTSIPVAATLSAETTKVIGTVNQGTSPWVTSATLAAETTKVIGTVNQGTSPWVVSSSTSTTSSITSVASSGSSVTLLASNANRKYATIFNESTKLLYVKLGATASATSYTVQMPPNSYYELPTINIYTGIIDGIWASANGNARLTELT
jgi:hypothetical protein